MSTSKGVTVKILGKDYQIACSDEQARNVLDASLLLDNRMREIRSAGRVIGLERIAVMAALNFAHEYLALKNEIKHNADDAEQRLLHLHEKLEHALNIHDIAE